MHARQQFLEALLSGGKVAAMPDRAFLAWTDHLSLEGRPDRPVPVLGRKTSMHNALKRSLRRPLTKKIVLEPGGRLRVDDRGLAGMLTKHGTLFVKPAYLGMGIGLGRGVMRLELMGNHVRVTSRDAKLLEVLLLHQPRDAKRTNNYTVDIACADNRLPQTLSWLLKEYTAFGMTQQWQTNPNAKRLDILAERGLRIPPYNGKVWEVRQLLLARPGKRLKPMAAYAKVGANRFVANLALGGHGEPPEHVVKTVYRSLLPQADRKRIEALAQKFMKQLQSESLTAAKLVSKYLERIRKRKYKDYPLGRVRVSNFSVDFAAEWDVKRNCLVPVIIDADFYAKIKGLHSINQALAREVEAGIKEIQEAFVLRHMK